MHRSTFVIPLLLLAFATAACGARDSLMPGKRLPFEQGGGGTGAIGGSGGTGGSGGSGGTAGTGGTGGTGGSVSTVVSEFADSLLESEAHIAVGNSGYVAVAWISADMNGAPFVAYTFSPDDGDTWQSPVAAPVPAGKYSGDPVLAVDEEGNFYLTYIGFNTSGGGDPQNMSVYVSRADSATTTFGPPVEVTDPQDDLMHDKPWMTVSPSGTVLVSWAGFSYSEAFLFMGRSIDGGQSFERITVDHSPSFSTYWNLAFPCADPGGDSVWLTYVQLSGIGGGIWVRRSNDDGASWAAGEAVVVSDEADAAFQDPNCMARGEELWVTYGLTDDILENETTQKLYATRAARSTDGGESIDLVVEAHDSDAAPFALLPNFALAPDGALHQLFYAGAYDEDPDGDIRRSVMPFGSGAFEPSLVVRAPIVFRQSRHDMGWLGDYTGVTLKDGKLYAAFPDNSSGASHVVFHRAPLP